MKRKLLSIILSAACIISAMCINNGDYMLIPEATSVRGDANDDGKLDIIDAAFIAKKIAQRKTNQLPTIADYNNDGKVNIIDAAAIAKTIAKRKLVTTTKVTTKVTTKTTKATTKTTVSVIPSTVYITKTGKRYHYDSTCNGGTYYSSTYKDAIAKGLTPCQKCVH